MSKIRFTEPRLLLSGERVEKDEERDFGASENAAFIANGVAVQATEEEPIEPDETAEPKEDHEATADAGGAA